MAASKVRRGANSWQDSVWAFLAIFTIPVLAALYLQFNLPPSWSLFAFALCSYYYLYTRIAHPCLFGPLRQLPMPDALSFLWGNEKALAQVPQGPGLLALMNEVPNDGLIRFRGVVWLGSWLIATTPEVLTEVLSTRAYDYKKPTWLRLFLRSLIGSDLVAVEGTEHHTQRKAISPAFQPKHIKLLVPVFWEKSQELVRSIISRISSEGCFKSAVELDIEPLASRVTLDIMGVAGLGYDLKTLSYSDHELAKAYQTVMDPNKGSLPLFFLGNAFLPKSILRRLPFGKFQEVAHASDRIRTICKDILAEKRLAIRDKPATKDGEKNTQVDIIAVLLRSGQFTDDGLIDQLLTFLAAGHETTSGALSWALYLLAIHPEIQTQLRNEVSTLKLVEAMDYTTIDNMPYLHAVCQESLRFYPLIQVTTRVPIKETRIGSTIVPLGSEIIICPWAINRLPSIWGEDADKFNPDRWIGSDKQPRVGSASAANAFQTFIQGPRNCIGQDFARNELKCLVASLVGDFTVEMVNPEEKVGISGFLASKPLNGLKLRLTKL